MHYAYGTGSRTRKFLLHHLQDRELIMMSSLSSFILHIMWGSSLDPRPPTIQEAVEEASGGVAFC